MLDPALAGHGDLRARLLEQARKGRLAGSLLLTGPEAVGKRRVALELAMRELCLTRSACGVCAGCRMLKTEPMPVEVPNLLRIAPEGKAGIIRIGAIRESDLVEGGVVRWAHQSPLPGCHRWILVEDAHRLNGASANMLLKTLEEPPPGTHFLLVTHRPDSVLQTIRSRCERVAFSALPEEEAWSVARRHDWREADRARWIALSAGTLRYLESEAFHRAVARLEAWIQVASGQPFTSVSAVLLPDASLPAAQSEQLAQVLELLLLLLADIARLREGAPLRLKAWSGPIEQLARSPITLRTAQAKAFHALRSLQRNPGAESLLREVAMSFRAGA